MKDCRECKFQCNSNISENDRQAIFDEFWNLSDDEKMQFYGRTTKSDDKKRKTLASGKVSRRKKVYNTTFHAMTITFEYVSNFI